jgi:hypothetical protein
MGRVSFGPPESCSWRVPLGGKALWLLWAVARVRRLSPVGKTNMLFINNKVKDMFYKNNN